MWHKLTTVAIIALWVSSASAGLQLWSGTSDDVTITLNDAEITAAGTFKPGRACSPHVGWAVPTTTAEDVVGEKRCPTTVAPLPTALGFLAQF